MNVLQRMCRDKLAALSLTVITLTAILGICAPWFAPMIHSRSRWSCAMLHPPGSIYWVTIIWDAAYCPD